MAVSVHNFAHFFNGQAPTEFLYEDDQCVVFEEENNRQAPVHFLVVPKTVIPRLSDASADDEKLLGHLLIVARYMAKERGLAESGFRVVINEGIHGGQKVDQFHVQVLGGRQMLWPFGHLLLVAKNIAVEKGLKRNGYHVMVDEDYRTNKFKSLHVFGRALHHMLWPTGPGCRL